VGQQDSPGGTEEAETATGAVDCHRPGRRSIGPPQPHLWRQYGWTIEGRFYEVTQTLHCEPNTLGYPKAALFAFCLALVASNAVALLRAALRAAHEEEAVDEMSPYSMALEIRAAYVGMMIALPAAHWAAVAREHGTDVAGLLREVAGYVKPEKYRKARRGPKKPPPKKSAYKNGGHVSTHKLLQKRQE
jgi:hypothetical protein